MQIETSLAAWSGGSSGGQRSSELDLGASLLRFGLADGLELRAAIDPWLIRRERADGSSTRGQGFGGAGVAIKARLTPRGAPIEVTLLPQVTLPTGSRRLGKRRVEAALLVPLAAALSRSLSLTATPEIDWDSDGEGRGYHGAQALALSLGRSFGPDFSAGIDVSHSRDRDPGGHSTATAAGLSLAWQAAPLVQMDLEADAGIGGAAPDLQLVAGLAIRR